MADERDAEARISGGLYARLDDETFMARHLNAAALTAALMDEVIVPALRAGAAHDEPWDSKAVGRVIDEHYRARRAADPKGPPVHECGSYCGPDIADRLAFLRTVAFHPEGLDEAWERHRNGYLFTKPTAIRSTEMSWEHRKRVLFEQGWHAALASSPEPVPSARVVGVRTADPVVVAEPVPSEPDAG